MSNGEDQHRFILRLRTAGSPRSVANPSRCRGVIGEVTELDRRHPKKRLRFAVGAVDAGRPSGARRVETRLWRVSGCARLCKSMLSEHLPGVLLPLERAEGTDIV